MDVAAMLDWFCRRALDSQLSRAQMGCSDRKLRLWACACCRAVWDGAPCDQCDEGYTMAEIAHGTERVTCNRCHGTRKIGGLTDARSRNAVLVAEKFADGEADAKELRAARMDAHWVKMAVVPSLEMAAAESCCPDAADAANRTRQCWQAAKGAPRAVQAALLRCIVGNPFQVVPGEACRWCRGTGDYEGRKSGGRKQCPNCNGTSRAPPPWVTKDVLWLARNMYDTRDWLVAPILADACEEAGCTDADILGHLRGPGPHARGCWCVDLILGKS